jgi:hypothetical protein
MYDAQNFNTGSRTTISHSKLYLIPGSCMRLWHIHYRNEILQCHHYVLSALRHILLYTFIVDGLDKSIFFFGKGNTFLIKGTHLILAISSYGEDSNLI